MVRETHPQAHGKIGWWHQTLKNRVLFENYFLPGDLETQIAALVNAYNNTGYHVSLGNLTPADVFFGRDQGIIENGRRIKEATLRARRLAHQNQVA